MSSDPGVETGQILDSLAAHPLRQEWIDELRGLLDIMERFSSNDQRARFLLNCNFIRDNGVDIANRIQALDSYWRELS